jgi:ubiquinone/menaquinone biosynthesis C-methylase UbiE
VHIGLAFNKPIKLKTMNTLNQEIENHYLKEGLYEDILQRLDDQAIDRDNVTRADIAGVDEFHVRGASVSRELASSIDLKGAHILDVGCGIGGPCRMLAAEFGCTSTGIDLSNEFIRTATALSKLVKMDGNTNFVVADAVNLPFENNSFDVVWTQHVQMNIPDKNKFYSEMNRVLKPGGHFMYYDIFTQGNGDINYPMPWASQSDQSFLIKAVNMHSILEEIGLSKAISKDETAEGTAFFEGMVAKMKEFGPPKMGLNVLMGEMYVVKPK